MCVAAVVAALGSVASALEIETVRVGNVGNAGELAGSGFGYYPPERICGAVDYTYNIGKYEVTAGQYTEFLNAVAATDTYGLYTPRMYGIDACGIGRIGNGTLGDPYRYRVEYAYVNRPVNVVSWGDAARFANWLHNGQPTGAQDLTTTEDGAYYLNGATSNEDLLEVTRKADWKWAIPTEDEWYKAAYYNPATSSYYDFPTSSNDPSGRDMTEETNPGNNANYRDASDWDPIDPPYYTTVAGEFELSDSPYGTFDQGGNVREWNEAVIVVSFGGPYRGLKGGDAYDRNVNATLAVNRGTGYPAGEVLGSGFRVSQVPEPATLSLLALGGLAMLKRRRK